jgi:bis(5'-nucleosyl)-tetraphosphatase (symmetrical)
MRYCYADGRLDLSYKATIADKPHDLMPWFDVPARANVDVKIVFGHWAALGGKADVPNVYPIDTGCVWGRELTALRLEDEQRFTISSHAARE